MALQQYLCFSYPLLASRSVPQELRNDYWIKILFRSWTRIGWRMSSMCPNCILFLAWTCFSSNSNIGRLVAGGRSVRIHDIVWKTIGCLTHYADSHWSKSKAKITDIITHWCIWVDLFHHILQCIELRQINIDHVKDTKRAKSQFFLPK